MRTPISKILPSGKLPIRVLDKFLKRYTTTDSSVIIGPSPGLDCAVIALDKTLVLVKTDPITFVSEDIGLYAIHINANDIACMGGRPRWFLVTILLPVGNTTVESAERVFSQLNKACRHLNVAFCGGHTEITHGIDRPIVVGHMLGVVEKDRLRSSAGARVNDDIILTKGVPLEAGSIIARIKGNELKGIFPEGIIKRCRNFVKTPGISVVKDAMVSLDNGEVHAMHDPTEGGLSMGLYELAMASKVGIIVEKDKIPFIPSAVRLLRYFGLDPMGAIASGALLISVAPKDTGKIIRALKRKGIRSACIGKVVDKREGLKIIEGGRKKTMKIYERDEMTKLI